MKYIAVLSFAVACKLQPFSTPREGGTIVVEGNTQQGVDFYLTINGGGVLIKNNNNQVVHREVHELVLRQPQDSQAIARDDDDQPLDGIDNIIIDSYQGKPRLLHVDAIKFTFTPNAKQPFVYTCKFSDIALGKVKFKVNSEGCTSNRTAVSHKKIIAEKCSYYAQIEVNNTAEIAQLNYHSQALNDGKAFNTGDVYVYKNTKQYQNIICEQHVIFDQAAVEYLQAHNLTCAEGKIKTPHMNLYLKYPCILNDVVIFSGQEDKSLKVLYKSKTATTGSEGDYFEGTVATIKDDGTLAKDEPAKVQSTTPQPWQDSKKATEPSSP